MLWVWALLLILFNNSWFKEMKITVFQKLFVEFFAVNFTVASTKKAKSIYADNYINFYIHPHSSH